MSKENNNDEIDLMQLFGMIKNAFKSFLKLIISIILFYKKKAILFLILIVSGGATGFFIDQARDSNNSYTQEVIIEPKYNSIKYIYDFVEELEESFKDDAFLNKLGIKPENILDVKEITIKPIVKGTDVLDNLQERYNNKEFFKDVMEAYEEDQLKEEGFRDFYKHHKLVFEFNNDNDYNSEITSSILDYIKSNKYYKGIMSLELKQKSINLERNKKSLQFIDRYLSNINNSPSSDSNDVVIIANESESPTIASLLKRKDVLLELINEQERILALDQEIFSFVYYGDIISKQKKLLNRTILITPLLLIGLVSLFYFSRYLSKAVQNFVKDEE